MMIRDAQVGEAGQPTAVARSAEASWGYPEAWLEQWEPALAITAEYVARHAVVVAEVDGRIVGVAALEEVGRDEPAIGRLWVLPDAQGRGAGRAPFARLAEVARERGGRSLRIESDPNARAFFERMRAELVGEVPAPAAGTDRWLPVLRMAL